VLSSILARSSLLGLTSLLARSYRMGLTDLLARVRSVVFFCSAGSLVLRGVLRRSDPLAIDGFRRQDGSFLSDGVLRSPVSFEYTGVLRDPVSLVSYGLRTQPWRTLFLWRPHVLWFGRIVWVSCVSCLALRVWCSRPVVAQSTPLGAFNTPVSLLLRGFLRVDGSIAHYGCLFSHDSP